MLAWLERHQYLVLAAALVFLAAAFIARDLTAERPPAIVLREAAPASTTGTVVVHIAGAVAYPGMYELPAGSRLQDAILAAGGVAEDADIDSLNLSRHLRDGEKITVVASGGTAVGGASTRSVEPLDINRASQSELERLRGIGEAYSRRIVDSRTVDGPYRSVEELVTRRVLPEATLNAVRDYLFVAP